MRAKRALLAVLAVLALATGAIFATAAVADPSHNIQDPQTLACDNGMTIVVNPGTVTNRSHEAFVIDSTSIFVVNYFAFDDGSGTIVLFDTAQGLTGLITCSGDVGGVFTITVRGFLTPR
jgi:hypothetical protein